MPKGAQGCLRLQPELNFLLVPGEFSNLQCQEAFRAALIDCANGSAAELDEASFHYVLIELPYRAVTGGADQKRTKKKKKKKKRQNQQGGMVEMLEALRALLLSMEECADGHAAFERRFSRKRSNGKVRQAKLPPLL